MSIHTVKFDDNIPPPLGTKKALQERLRLSEMEPGQSFFYPGELKDTDRVKNAVLEYGKEQDPKRTFATERRREKIVDEGTKKEAETDGLRVWRLS